MMISHFSFSILKGFKWCMLSYACRSCLCGGINGGWIFHIIIHIYIYIYMHICEYINNWILFFTVDVMWCTAMCYVWAIDGSLTAGIRTDINIYIIFFPRDEFINQLFYWYQSCGVICLLNSWKRYLTMEECFPYFEKRSEFANVRSW